MSEKTIVERPAARPSRLRPITKETLLDRICFIAFGGGIAKYGFQFQKSLLEFRQLKIEKEISRQTIQLWFASNNAAQYRAASIPKRQGALTFLYSYVTESISSKQLTIEQQQVYDDVGIFLRNNLKFSKESIGSGRKGRWEAQEEKSKIAEKKIYEFIFSKWRSQRTSGEKLLFSGAYQLFRRYKPTKEFNVHGGNDRSNVEEHAVICEVIYIDVPSMTCTLVTAERDIYYGIIAINFKNTLSILLQRDSGRGIHYRFISIPLWKGINISGLFSGVMIKTGDTSERPIASELLIKWIPPTFNLERRKFYREIRQIIFGPSLLKNIQENSEVLQYLTDIPQEHHPLNHKSWRRVRKVKNFKIISDLSVGEDWALFREPLRTFDRRDLLDLSIKYADFGIFMQATEK
jgi:hypothetical protein